MYDKYRYMSYSEVLGVFLKTELQQCVFKNRTSPTATRGQCAPKLARTVRVGKAVPVVWSLHANEARSLQSIPWEAAMWCSSQGLIRGGTAHVGRQSLLKHLWGTVSSPGCRRGRVSIAILRVMTNIQACTSRWRGGGCKHVGSVG